MKVLVIPDVHLKPWMFDRASKMMKAGKADRAVCLMDIPDDWNQELNLDLYMQTYDRAIRFEREYPDTMISAIHGIKGRADIPNLQCRRSVKS